MSCYTPPQMHSYSNTSQRLASQQFFNMTGSHLMIYSPVASLGMFSSFRSSDSDNSFRSSFDKEQSEFSSTAHKEFSKKTASLTSQRSETYSALNGDNTDSVVIEQTLQSAPCDNSENNQNDMRSSACVSDHETMKKPGEVKDALNHGSAVSSVGDGESRWRSDWAQSVRKYATTTTSPFSGQVKEKFIGPRSVGGSVDICRIRSGDADDVAPGNSLWRPVENVGSTGTEHERKKVSFENGFSWSGYSAAEGEATVHNVKSQNPSRSFQMDGINEGNSQSGREFQGIVDSAPPINRWFDTKRLSTTQSRDPFDYFQNTSFTPACLQSKSTTSFRRRSEPPYLPTMVAKWTVVEESDIERYGRETQVGTRNRSLNRSTRSSSETRLLHLTNTDRISRHAEHHIVKKYGLDLLDNRAGGSKYEDFHGCLDFANVSANNNNVDYGQHPQGAASLTASGGPKENSDNQIEAKSKGFSLRRPFQKFQKKAGPLDKSRSVAGPGLDKSCCHEDASPRRPVSAALQAKDSESSFGESSEQKAASNIERKMKKPHRKFGLNLFRKSRDGFTKEPSKDRGQAEFEGQGNKEYESSKQAEDVDTSRGYDRDVIESSETARGRSPHQQQEPELNCPEHLQNQTELTCGSETVSKETSCDVSQDKKKKQKKKKRKAESKKDLSSKISDGSVSTGKDASAKSSHVIVPLEAKTSVVFHDAVFYFPPEDKPGCDDENSQPAAVSRSESKVPRPSKSSSLRVPAKVAISDAKDKGMIEYSRPSILKRMRAFFGRSASIGSSYNVAQASSSTLLDTASGQDKESRGIEEWRWSGARGQGNADPVREETSSPTDLENLLTKSQKEHEAKADESGQGADEKELTKTESKLKDN